MAHSVVRWTWVVAALACGAPRALGDGEAARHAGPPAIPRRAAVLVEPATPRSVPLSVNQLAMQVSNVGSFALRLERFDAGLEFPRGSGRFASFAAGLNVGGRVAGVPREAIAEFGWSFVPGPLVGGLPSADTTLGQIFAVSRDDTVGRAEWMARAVPIGAPVDSTGTAPGLIGERTLWTAFHDTDHSRTPTRMLTDPIGLEVQCTAYAFDRPGPLGRAAFLHWRLVNTSAQTLDSAYVALFHDPKVSATILAAADTTLDLGYAYRGADDDLQYGAAAPAVGLTLLRGPRDSSGPLRPTSFVVYVNGTDPADPEQFYDVMSGRLPSGADMIDPTTSQPSRFWSTGDPVTGTGWVSALPIHPHTWLSAGPFTFAAGDTQVVDAALVIGYGADRIASVADLRAAVIEVRREFANGFADAPPPYPRLAAVRVRPNPAGVPVTLDLTVPGDGAVVRITIYDLAGRRVRALPLGRLLPGYRSITWDGTDDDGRRVPGGVYLARTVVAGRESVVRIALLR